MIDLLAAARELQEYCDSEGWRSCFIGGLAVQRWGQPRITRDIDITLMAGFGEEAEFIDALLSRYPSRLKDARAFAIRSRVLLLATANGIGIDVSLGALGFEESAVQRATPFAFAPGLELRTCSAEDLLVMKLFAGRPIDLRDAETIAARNRGHLVWQYVETQLAPFAEVKEDSNMLLELARIRGQE